MGDIFQEVDEELRKDRLEKLWKEYGRYAVAAAVLVVLVAAGWKGWEFYADSQRQAASQQYEAAGRLLADGKKTDAIALFSALGQEGFGKYKVLAKFQQAALLADNNDTQGAIGIYKAIADDSNQEKSVRDAARLFSVLLHLDDPNADLTALKGELDTLRAKDNPWRFSATEFYGLIQIREGDIPAARKTLQAVADDLEAPGALRARATQVLSVLTRP